MAQGIISLDTNYLIRTLIAGTSEADRVRLWIERGISLSCSSIVWYEFLCGPVGREEIEVMGSLLTAGIWPFGAKEAGTASRLFNATGRKRHLRVDAMIAATAIVQGSSFATENKEDFRVFIPFELRLTEE